MQSSRYSSLLLCLAGALLLWAAWPTSPFTFLVFVAWVPLLFVAERTSRWGKFLGYTYIHMLLWNLLTTWWVANSTLIGSLSAFLVNSLVMCIPWLLYFGTKKYIRGFISLFVLVAYWITFEYIHHNWDLSWPWLTLGNVFATHPGWVQWYEYTGTTGGSFWVLFSNILVFRVLQLYRQQGRSSLYFKNAAAWALLLILPVLFSLFVKQNLTLLHNKYNVVVVQPNIDPYEKVQEVNASQQLQTLLSLSQSQVDENTRLVIWPETAIPARLNEAALKETEFMYPVWEFLKRNPHVNLLTGIEGYKIFSEKHSRYATALPDGTGYYESYNSAALLDSSATQIYHKSKLVPGVEVLPWFVSFMAPLFEKFGGTTGGYSKDTAAKDLTTTNNSFVITPAICYESVYGDYLADFNRKASNLIGIITNDGWWGNTDGHKQHMNYARLRAIESRKWVARSANTGISCFIDPYGNIIQQLPWDQQGALKQTVSAFVTETFYTKYGDWLSKIVLFATAAFLLLLIYKIIQTQRQQKLKYP